MFFLFIDCLGAGASSFMGQTVSVLPLQNMWFSLHVVPIAVPLKDCDYNGVHINF